ncbi:hypothetical protein [Actinomadura rugatobispora]|uniref:Uncharacterized protein n=1 Tax=Actinomadura rugatobispora TaxID=1994 RepID=A0ABW1ADB0_9ACTN
MLFHLEEHDGLAVVQLRARRTAAQVVEDGGQLAQPGQAFRRQGVVVSGQSQQPAQRVQLGIGLVETVQEGFNGPQPPAGDLGVASMRGIGQDLGEPPGLGPQGVRVRLRGECLQRAAAFVQ